MSSFTAKYKKFVEEAISSAFEDEQHLETEEMNNQNDMEPILKEKPFQAPQSTDKEMNAESADVAQLKLKKRRGLFARMKVGKEFQTCETATSVDQEVEEIVEKPIPDDASKVKGSKWSRFSIRSSRGSSKKYLKVGTSETGNALSEQMGAMIKSRHSNEDIPTVEMLETVEGSEIKEEAILKEVQKEKEESFQAPQSTDNEPTAGKSADRALSKKLKGRGIFGKRKRNSPSYETTTTTNELDEEEVETKSISDDTSNIKESKWSRFFFKIQRGAAIKESRIGSDETGNECSEQTEAEKDGQDSNRNCLTVDQAGEEIPTVEQLKSEYMDDQSEKEPILKENQQEKAEPLTDPQPTEEETVDKSADVVQSNLKIRKRLFARMKIGKKFSTCEAAPAVDPEVEEIEAKPIPDDASKVKERKWSRFSIRISRGSAKKDSKVETAETGNEQADATIKIQDSNGDGCADERTNKEVPAVVETSGKDERNDDEKEPLLNENQKENVECTDENTDDVKQSKNKKPKARGMFAIGKGKKESPPCEAISTAELEAEEIETKAIPVDASKAKGSKWSRFSIRSSRGSGKKNSNVGISETGNECSENIEAAIESRDSNIEENVEREEISSVQPEANSKGKSDKEKKKKKEQKTKSASDNNDQKKQKAEGKYVRFFLNLQSAGHHIYGRY